LSLAYTRRRKIHSKYKSRHYFINSTSTSAGLIIFNHSHYTLTVQTLLKEDKRYKRVMQKKRLFFSLYYNREKFALTQSTRNRYF